MTIIPTERNPMRDALENWEILQSDNDAKDDQIRELTSCNANLLAEVDYLRQTMARLTSERDRYQRYAIELTTRLSTIRESIDQATAASREYAVKPPVPGYISVGEAEAEKEAKEAADLIARLPQNRLM
jgi:chromosome segregation ATPase